MTSPTRARASDTPKLDLRLAALECSTLEGVPTAPAEDIPVLWADRAQMLLDPSALAPVGPVVSSSAVSP